MDAMRTKRQAAARERVENIETRRAKDLHGLYDVIEMDPPWPGFRFGFSETNLFAGSPFDYPTMSVNDIQTLVGEKLARHAYENCYVFVWTTHKFLPITFDLLQGLGTQVLLHDDVV